MLHEQLPPFVLRGTFSWTKHGYHFGEPPSFDLLAPEALSADNPWIVLSATLEHAKRGDHSFVRNLERWFRADSPFYIGRVCILVTGDAGTNTDLNGLVRLMEQGPDDHRVYACKAAESAGSVWLVPHMLAAWHRVTSLGDHETIGYAISDLLEGEEGLIAARAGAYTLDEGRLGEPPSAKAARLAESVASRSKTKSEEFDQLVRAKWAEVVLRVGSETVPVWAGELYNVSRFAQQLHSMVLRDGSNPGLWDLFIPLRRKFEAATGIDCSGFFRNEFFQPLSAAAILEQFLQSESATRYQGGVRYFFGHPIPD